MSGVFAHPQSLQKSLAAPIYLKTEIKISALVVLCTVVVKYTSPNLGRRQLISA